MTTQSSRKMPDVAGDAGAPPGNQSQPQRSGPPVEAITYLAGEVIGDRYRLVREIGRGGMGVVWVAHSLVLGVDVALKLIRASGAGARTTSRMAREAHAAARLGHPALVRVFDFGWTSRGDPFLVMELVQGETLSAMLERDTRIAAIRAVQMLLPIADGLRLAHEKTIVHRDIKPDNIFLAKDALGRTQPKLIDFGIAKVGPATYDGKLTQVGAVLGSPEYMSPEQALGVDDVDERTDIWSLSVVLYEMVTGTIPFRKANYNALMHAIINDAPKSITEYNAGDATLWQVVERGLAKSREERWPNVTEFGEALAFWLYEHGIKEDLSGNSIRAVWLDGALSVARDLPPSAAPDVRHRSPADSNGNPFRLNDPMATTMGETLAAPRLPAIFSRKRNLALALALGIALGAGGIAAAFGGRDRSVVAAKGTKTSPATPAAASEQASALPSPKLEPSDAPFTQSPVNAAPPESSKTTGALPTTDAAASRAAAPKTSTKQGVRAPRRRHDFGF
jgi:serine/threonine protein kinase